MEFKNAGKRDGSSDTLYFNAYTEDLFAWDNDLENDTERYLRLNTASRFFPASKSWRWKKKFFRTSNAMRILTSRLTTNNG